MASAPQPNPAHQTQLPPAIRRQAEQADKLQRESIGEPAPDTPPPNGAAPPAGETPPPAPATPPPPQAAPDAEERIRTTEGRLAVEREKRQALENEVNNLRRMVNDLQTRQRDAPPPAPVPAPTGRKLVTPEEEADYGKDLLEVMGKRAREEVAGEIDGLKEEINKLRGQLGQVGSRVTQRDTEDVFTELHRQVPGWVEQNSDDGFIAWLQQPEPFSGIKRHDLLTRAFDSHDANRVIRFFQGFRAEAAATGQAPGPATPPPAPAANGKVPLETFAAPGRASPAHASAPPGEKPQYTRAQISQFYTDKAAGRWRGREAQAADIEADIFRAGPEGRVIG
jgi:hypothetical protein